MTITAFKTEYIDDLLPRRTNVVAFKPLPPLRALAQRELPKFRMPRFDGVRPFHIAFGGAAVLAMVLVLGVRAIPMPERIVIEKPPEVRFDAAWADAFQTAAIAARKTDREVRIVPITTAPKPIVTERIVPQPEVPAAVPPVLTVADEPTIVRHAQRRSPSRAVAGDVCTRHNMRKVMVGKYKWRCKR